MDLLFRGLLEIKPGLSMAYTVFNKGSTVLS